MCGGAIEKPDKGEADRTIVGGGHEHRAGTAAGLNERDAGWPVVVKTHGGNESKRVLALRSISARRGYSDGLASRIA